VLGRPRLAGAGGPAGSDLLPEFCGSTGLSGNSLWPVPRFHENALLKVDGRDDDVADDGAGCAAGDERVAQVSRAETCFEIPSVPTWPGRRLAAIAGWRSGTSRRGP
jgi:hypothetical protein